MGRGGKPEDEIRHGRELAARGAEAIWGWDTPAGKARVASRSEWFRRVCGLGPDVKVLECGCGTGIFTRQLARTGADVTAVDISEDLLREAKQLCPAENVRFLVADLENPDNIPDGAFDVMVGVSVLHHLKLPKALAALAPKLKEGGLFAFSEPNLLNPINRFVVFSDDMERRRRLGVSPGEMAFRPAELQAFFEQAGYSVDRVQHRDFLHPSTPAFLVPLVGFVGTLAERIPGVRRWSGSLWICGRRGDFGTGRGSGSGRSGRNAFQP